MDDNNNDEIFTIRKLKKIIVAAVLSSVVLYFVTYIVRLVFTFGFAYFEELDKINSARESYRLCTDGLQRNDRVCTTAKIDSNKNVIMESLSTMNNKVSLCGEIDCFTLLSRILSSTTFIIVILLVIVLSILLLYRYLERQLISKTN
jgi:magnesium-transporting ATPase (P-type)